MGVRSCIDGGFRLSRAAPLRETAQQAGAAGIGRLRRGVGSLILSLSEHAVHALREVDALLGDDVLSTQGPAPRWLREAGRRVVESAARGGAPPPAYSERALVHPAAALSRVTGASIT